MRHVRFHRWVQGLVAILLLNCGAVADGTIEWWDRAADGQAGHYWIKTDLPRDEAFAFAEHLNRFHDAFDQRLGSLEQRFAENLNVLIFQHREDYLYTLQSRWRIDGRGSAGMFFIRDGFGALAFWVEGRPRQRVLATMQHEAFHQFARSRFGRNLPVWANEGLATFFGESVLVGRTLVIGQASELRVATVRDAAMQNKHIPFRDILSMDSQTWLVALREGSARMQYDQAFSMVQFLIYGEGGRYQRAFERYLWLLNDNVPFEQAFIDAFGTDDFEEFEKRWLEYAVQAQPSSFVTAMERLEFLAEGTLALHRRGILPTSLDELREELQRIEFSHTTVHHGIATTLDAEDEENFAIPMDDLARQQPVFKVQEVQVRPRSRRERAREEANPTPPTIETTHLRPHRLSVRWYRNEDDDGFTYDIQVQ